MDKNFNNNGHLITVHQAVKKYKSTAGEFTALKGVDMIIDSGEFVSIAGKSGSGKSTLLNLISGIDLPTSGGIFVREKPIHLMCQKELSVWRGRNIGIIFQFFQLMPTLTVLENVMLPMDFCNIYNSKKRKITAQELLERVGVLRHANKLPSTLSGGEQQRVAIARAMANNPSIIMADEPTGNLDSKTSEVIFSFFQELVHEGKTVIMITHNTDLAARAKRTINLCDGKIINV